MNNPILLAGGVIGTGDSLPHGITMAHVGAAVVGPITYRSRRGDDPPRLAETTGGFVLNTGMQNRGVRATIKRYCRGWQRLGCPVIAQVADREPEWLRRVVSSLEEIAAVTGIELLLHPQADASEIRLLIESIIDACELPLWVKLPFDSTQNLAAIAVTSGADALVVAQPPLAMITRSDKASSCSSQLTVSGQLHGSALFPLVRQKVSQIAAMELGVPVISSGGIHSWQDVRDAMNSGASAAQLGSALWVEPSLAQQLVSAWNEFEESAATK